jgi:acyl-CoA-binding protein
MSLEDQFNAAQAKSKTLAQKPSNDVLLKLYSLFKQGAVGDVNVERPSGFDFVGAAKFDAWEALKGQSKEEAQQAYIDYVESLF